jgi:hypothetical protein
MKESSAMMTHARLASVAEGSAVAALFNRVIAEFSFSLEIHAASSKEDINFATASIVRPTL